MGIIQCNLLQISKLRKTVKKYDTIPLPLQTYISTPRTYISTPGVEILGKKIRGGNARVLGWKRSWVENMRGFVLNAPQASETKTLFNSPNTLFISNVFCSSIVRTGNNSSLSLNFISSISLSLLPRLILYFFQIRRKVIFFKFSLKKLK